MVRKLPVARGYHARSRGEVAQLVEHTTENRGVAGSIPALAIAVGRDAVVWLLHDRVRFSPVFLRMRS
jgi:hypothetical protein